MVKISDIAEKVGVSKGTVSKALNGANDISETLRNKIIEEATVMGYVKANMKKVCILIQNTNYKLRDDFGYDIISGFKQFAKKNNHNVIIVDVTQELQDEINFDEFMKKNKFVGCFVIGFSYHDKWLSQFKQSLYPSVLLDNESNNGVMCARVGIDSEEAMDLVIKHLHEQGHSKIAYLSGELGAYYSKNRFNAFKKALDNYELEFNENLYGEHYLVSECIAKNLPRILENSATAIVCCHDLLANGALIQCQQMGYNVPEDISIVGFDNLPFTEHTIPPITTINQNRLHIGKSAYYALDSLVNSVLINTIYIHAELIIRNSTSKKNER